MNFKNISKKQLIILLLTCLILLLVLNKFLSSLNSNTIINYKNSNGASLVKEASVEYDRNVYYNADNLIEKYVDSFSNDSKEYIDYYKNSLTDEYKKYLSKSKYKKRAKEFYQKFIDNSTIQTTLGEQLQTSGSLYDSGMLAKIYKINENGYYLCELKLKDDKKAYIGLYFNTNFNKAYIFYIEW